MKKSTLVAGLLTVLVGGIVIVVPGAVFPIAALVKILAEAQNAPHRIRIPEESNPEKVRNSLYYLKTNEYIKIKQVGKRRFKFELTKKGKKLLARYNFAELALKAKRPWDGQWRMLVFDVPEKNRWARDSLRERLKQMGFFQFQKSVWLYPYECEEEMNYVAEFLGIQYCTLMFTGKIHNDQLLRKYFVREGVLQKSDLYKT